LGTVKRAARNSAIVFAGTLSIRSISLVVTIYLARYLTVEGFGKYGLVTAFIPLFAIVANLGIPTILVRGISRDRSQTAHLVGTAASMAVILSLLAILVSIAAGTLAGYSPDIQACIALFSMTLLFDSLRNCFASVFEANLRMEYDVASKIIDRGVSAALIVWIILSGGSLLQVLAALTVSRGLALLVAILGSRRFLKIRPTVDTKIWRYFILESATLALLTVFSTIHMRIDKIMLQAMLGNAAVGYYSVAYRLIDSLKMFSVALVISAFPLLSVYFGSSRELFRRVYALSFRYLSSLSVLIAALGLSLSKPVILLLFGEKYLPSVQALQVLLWSLPFLFVGVIFSRVLIAAGLQKLNLYFAGVAACLNISLNLVLIPTYGTVGAASATLVSYSSMIGIGLLSRSTRSFSVAGLYSLVKPLVAATPIIFLSYATSPFFVVLLGLPAYLGFLTLIGGLNREDLAIIRKILQRRTEEALDSEQV
jgi:O-antigen/teichoic acid export membrane protein